ncbi:MAG: sensor histidine kinase [Pseudodesulfovibrio sp.]
MSSTASDNHIGLRFFGKVSASVSHEIKNIFAVINEAAGLVEDFTLMTERGMPIEPERLKRVANSIQGQIQRGDAIVKNMNALAHSTDEDIQKVDLVEALSLTVALATRMADMKQAKLELGECDSASAIVHKFSLIQLLHGAIALALEPMSPHATLVLSLAAGDAATISLSIPGQGVNLKPDDELLRLAQQLNISVANNETNGGLDLTLERVD